MEAEEIIVRALLVILQHPVDAVLQPQPALERALGIERRHQTLPAHPRAH